ncbi:MAG: hypothetical protein V4649_19395 [Bacteroidota bacterium]
MRTRYRYRVTLTLGAGPFRYFDTYNGLEAINIACMLQIAQGQQATPNLWHIIGDRHMRSVTDENIELSRTCMEGDMSVIMREVEADNAR